MSNITLREYLLILAARQRPANIQNEEMEQYLVEFSKQHTTETRLFAIEASGNDTQITATADAMIEVKQQVVGIFHGADDVFYYGNWDEERLGFRCHVFYFETHIPQIKRRESVVVYPTEAVKKTGESATEVMNLGMHKAEPIFILENGRPTRLIDGEKYAQWRMLSNGTMGWVQDPD